MKKILINHNAWETRVAVLRENKLQDIYFDSSSKNELERSFFKGRAEKVLPGIQTAFVNINQPKAGFLHITEVDRALAVEKTVDRLGVTDKEEQDTIERKIKQDMNIANIFRENEDILVQVTKEPIHGKGAKLTTCFTLPGRLIVLMPNVPQIGISKKIEDREERTRLKTILTDHLPSGMGAVVRTTAEGKSYQEIKKDLAFLVATWRSIKRKFRKASVGERVHEDLPLTLRVVRDHLDKDVEVIITDDASDNNRIQRFIRSTTPEHDNEIHPFKGPGDLFDHYDINKQIEAALQKKVQLPSGGSLIIESTEAMSVIDVNTGRYTGKTNLEETILKTNLEAAEEIVTQLRLRNVGGLIVIDFIDMAQGANRQKLSRFLSKTLKERDKFQTVALKVSELGLVQMTRKRSGKTLVAQLTNTCETCNSYGFVKSVRSVSYELLGKFKERVLQEKISGPMVLITPKDVFEYLVHNEYSALLKLEKTLQSKLILECNDNFTGSEYRIDQVREKK